MESAHELRRLALVAGRTVRADVRCRAAGQPGRRRGLAGSHRMTGAPTPFGIAEDQLAEVVALAGAGPVRLIGFHLHAVSNNLDAAAHAAFVADARRLVGDRGRAGSAIDLRIRQRRRRVRRRLHRRPRRSTSPRCATCRPPPGVRLVVEPGRWLAADAGWYAAEVLDLKRTHGRWFAVLRGGTHHFRLPAAWGYSHPFTVLPVDAGRTRSPGPRCATSHVDAVGELCTPRDVLTRGAARSPGCGSATCWSSRAPARTAGTSPTTTSCVTRTPRCWFSSALPGCD